MSVWGGESIYNQLEEIKKALASIGSDKLLTYIVNLPANYPLPSDQVTDLKNIRYLTPSDRVSAQLYAFDPSTSSWQLLKTDGYNRLKVQLDYLPNPSSFDVNLSSRASEATLSAIKNALASVATDKLRTSIVDALPESPFNITKVAGTALTGRDWSGDLAKLQNLDIALSALRDALKQSTIDTTTYTKSLADVWYQLTQTLAVHEQTPWNPPNLDVALSSRASEATLSSLKNALASVAADKFCVSVVDALPAGANTIGNVNAIKSGTWNIDNLLNPHPVAVNREGTVSHFSVSATAAGSTTIYTPSSGKAVQVLGWSFICDADVTCLLRFTTSGNVIAGLPAKGAHAMNLLGLSPPQGAANETVEIYVSGAANIKGFIVVKEV